MKSNIPLVSIITPVFNASPYLHRCIDSLLRQTYDNIEVVVVNDCSTDSSSEILASYAQQNNRILVFNNEENIGAPASRLKALSCLHGEYVVEVDADDWLEDNAIELAMGCLISDEDVDIAVLQLAIHDIDGEQVKQPTQHRVPRVMSGIDACYWSMDWTISGIFVAKRSVFEATPYISDCGVYSDENTTHLQYLHSNKVVLTDAIYHFTMNDTSVTHTVNIKRFDILEGRIAFRRQLINEHAEERLLRKQALTMWHDYIGSLLLFVLHKREFTDDEQQIISQRLRLAYKMFNLTVLPLSEALKPGYILLPSYDMFYTQMLMVNKVRKLLKR